MRRSVWTPALERIERDLAHHRVDHVLDLGREHRLALLGVRIGRRQQPLEGQHLAEHARGFRQRQRRRRHQRTVRRRQHLMHAVTQFMRQRHHVARLALIVEQHIGVRRRRRSDARRRPAPCPARTGASIQRSSKKRCGDRRPCAARSRHRRSSTVSCASAQPIWRMRRERQRRVAVPVRRASSCRTTSPSTRNSDATAADRPRAPTPPAHRRPRARRGSTRWRAVGDVGEAAPAIGDFLVLGERVGDRA